MVKSVNSLSLLIKTKLFKRIYAKALQSPHVLTQPVSEVLIDSLPLAALRSSTQLIVAFFPTTALPSSWPDCTVTTALSAISLVSPRLSLLLSQPDTLWHGGGLPGETAGKFILSKCQLHQNFSQKQSVNTQEGKTETLFWRIVRIRQPYANYKQKAVKTVYLSHASAFEHIYSDLWLTGASMCFFSGMKRQI